MGRRIERISCGWRGRFQESVGRKTSITWINGKEHTPGGTTDALRAHELGRERLVDAYLLTNMPESLAGITKIANTPYMALSEYAPHLCRALVRSPPCASSDAMMDRACTFASWHD